MSSKKSGPQRGEAGVTPYALNVATKQMDGVWEWTAWLDGPRDAILAVDHVVYGLPPSFPKPVRRKTDASSNFQMNEQAWGGFVLTARVVRKDGSEVQLSKEVELVSPDEAAGAEVSGPPPPTVPRPSWPRPPFRRLRVYAFDPSLDTQLEMAVINQIVVKAPWEEGLEPGPVGEYLEVIDFDPASAAFYPPIDLVTVP